MPINSVGEYFCVSKELRYRNFSSKGGRKLHGFVEIFLNLTGPKKLRQGTNLCFRKFLVGKKISRIRGGGVSRFSVEKILSHCTKILHWRTLWCFRKILLSKIFMHRRGGITVLPKFFVSQDRNEKLCKRTLLFPRKFLVSKKIYGQKGACHDFQSKFSCLTVPKNFVKEPFSVSQISGIKKMLKINRENNWHGRDSNPKPTAWECSCPNPTAVIYFWIKRVGIFGLIEKTTLLKNNFSCILHMLRKVTNAKNNLSSHQRFARYLRSSYAAHC